MSEYQIGQDIQVLRMRLEALERKHGLKSRPLKEGELSATQEKNLKLLRKQSREIVSGMNRILNEHGINLFMTTFPLLSDEELAGTQLFAKAGGCCCENGIYVPDCDLCGFIIPAPPGTGIPIPIP